MGGAIGALPATTFIRMLLGDLGVELPVDPTTEVFQ
jgi:hypothetical protein